MGRKCYIKLDSYKSHFACLDYTIKINPKKDIMLLNGLDSQIKIKCMVLLLTHDYYCIVTQSIPLSFQWTFYIR
jgi:hypothetical protein